MLTCRSASFSSSLGTLALAAGIAFAPLQARAADNTFKRTFKVSGGVTRVELSNSSGNVEIRGGADGQVHIQGTVTPGGWALFGNTEKNAQEVVANPPLEQNGDTIRIGKSSSWLKNVSIEYKIEVPRSTEIDAGVASGGITVSQVKGPVKANSASGYVHVYNVERDVQVSAASGSIEVTGIGGYVSVNSASGDVTISDTKGDVKATAASGSIRIQRPGDRVEASSASGAVEVVGANKDVKVHLISGSITVIGNPTGNRLWDLKTVSGSVEIKVPSNASFLLSAESTSGGIRTSMPVIIEEQNKHSLRAHVGDSSGRVEVHTVSGGIDVRSGS
jgi:DUF4097 and DUF4098 domain-containing protein YvlB